MAEVSGILLIDKPQEWTSHDIVAKLRGLMGTKKVGHAGTLDPMATGLLTVFVGRATRAVEFAESDEKEYIASLRLGLRTDTQDIWGSITEENSVLISREILCQTAKEFVGDIEQIPPMYSAIKIKGKKLYDLARKGITVERKPRNVRISTLEIIHYSNNRCEMRVVCSKGTYIRTLCNDIGDRIGCGGVMDSLRRTRCGSFTIEDAVTLEDIRAAEDRSIFLKPVDTLFNKKPIITLSKELERRHRNGQKIPFTAKVGIYRIYSEYSGEFLSLSEVKSSDKGTYIELIKSFYSV